MTIAGAGPLSELRTWAFAALRADAGMQSVFGSGFRIYDDVQINPAFPYTSLGPDEDNPQQADGINGSEIYFTLDVWGRSGRAEVAAGMNAINRVLDRPDEQSVSLDNYRILNVHRYKQSTMKDNDGLTTHGVITFRALIDPTNRL